MKMRQVIQRRLWFMSSELQRELEHADKIWKCNAGDNPDCELEENVPDLIKNCASNEQVCNAQCTLYRATLRYNNKKLKLKLNGKYYVRSIVSDDFVELRIQET